MAAVIGPHKAMNFHDFLPAHSYLICHFESCNVAIICFVFPFQKVGIFYSFLQSWEITNHFHMLPLVLNLLSIDSKCQQLFSNVCKKQGGTILHPTSAKICL